MVDKAKVEQAIRLLLEGIGENPDREGLKDTPDRIARMCTEIYGGLDEEADQHLLKQFQVENNEMVLEKDITFYSMCEHHMLPFFGKCSIGYIPKGKIFGVSKLARIVDMFARRLQIQERLSNQIARTIYETIQPEGVGVVMEAQHLCMLMRGVQKQNSTMVTSAMFGSFRSQQSTRMEFLKLIKN